MLEQDFRYARRRDYSSLISSLQATSTGKILKRMERSIISPQSRLNTGSFTKAQQRFSNYQKFLILLGV